MYGDFNVRFISNLRKVLVEVAYSLIVDNKKACLEN